VFDFPGARHGGREREQPVQDWQCISAAPRERDSGGGFWRRESAVHALVIDSGWRDVADKALEFVRRVG
jgi:hypothetical protein